MGELPELDSILQLAIYGELPDYFFLDWSVLFTLLYSLSPGFRIPEALSYIKLSKMTATLDVEEVLSKLNIVEKVELLAGKAPLPQHCPVIQNSKAK